MLKSVVIYEVTLIEVCVPANLLPIVLVKHPDVLREVALIVESVEALAWSQFAVAIRSVFLLITDPLIGHKWMPRLFK